MPGLRPDEPAALAHLPASGHPFRLRSTYLPGTNTVEYEPGRDFVADFATGTLRRTPDSRIPDFRTNVLYGQQEFDHSKFPGFGNSGFFAFARSAWGEDSGVRGCWAGGLVRGTGLGAGLERLGG